jgi:hypothetical protein
MGGVEVLGPVISPLFVHNNVKYQYTQAGLMAHDPGKPASKRYHLAPIGLDMEIAEPPVSPPSQPTTNYVGGHIIFDDFLPLYDRLGGASVIGNPLTEMHYNPEKRRYEQFFENLGFYRLDSQAETSVYLLAYGAWKCGENCRNPSPEKSQVVLPNRIGQEFREAINRLGPGFTGFAISDPYYTPDGYLEQIFENMVLVVDPQSAGGIILRPITRKIGFLPDPPVAPKDPSSYQFMPVSDDKGYNIPNYFLDYLAQHGGLEIAGQPIGEETLVGESVYRQCFTNLCLDRRENLPEYLYIRPAPIGYTYRQLPLRPVKNASQQAISPAATPQVTDAPLSTGQTMNPEVPTALATGAGETQSREVTIQIWEQEPLVPPGQSQELRVRILENGAPLPFVEPYIVLVLPDGGRKTYHLYPTDSNGESAIEVDPIVAPNGTLIPYQACITDISGQRVCVKDSYVIWEQDQG